jgi:hypothetical protein
MNCRRVTPFKVRITTGYTIAMLRRTRVAGPSAFRPRRTRALWPLAVGVAIRLVAWVLVPTTRFASDEDSYFQVGTALLTLGHQDVFWPPVTGWLIAFIRWTFHTDSIAVVRLVWIAMDIGCLLVLQRLAGAVGDAVWPVDAYKAARFETVVTAAYAVYLPAVSHAQFATSETPALLLTLSVLALLVRPAAGAGTFLAAGLLAGLLVLTRTSLLPLLVLLPLAGTMGARPRRPLRALVFVLAGSSVVGAYASGNWLRSGDFTIATNSAYNLYIGNRELYAEDLNLLAPRATPEQIEFRRQQWSGELVYPSGTPAELQRQAFAQIAEHPGLFVRRAVGRLARVFAPKTDVLEMVGGERAVGIFTPSALVPLAVANLQWTVVLFGGVLGLAALRHLNVRVAGLMVATIGGALVLCAVAISKPRYSFVFDPLLIMGAALCVASPRQCLGLLGRRDWWAVAILFAFFVWSWVAFVIFSFSSRGAL